MHARSAVVDLYGDHLGSRGWWAPVSAVVALAGAVEVRPPAVRTAVSRLSTQGFLVPETRQGARGYAATPLAQERWRRAHGRVYASDPRPWDGRWHVVQVEAPGDRRRRDQLVTTLAYHGYGRLGGTTWISPWTDPELAASLGRLDLRWVAVAGELDGAGPGELVARVWDLASLAQAYDDLARSCPEPEEAGSLGPATAYPARTRLVHAWRRFLFRDPGLPREVLPDDWSGDRARARFLAAAQALAPAADAHVDAVLSGPGG